MESLFCDSTCHSNMCHLVPQIGLTVSRLNKVNLYYGFSQQATQFVGSCFLEELQDELNESQRRACLLARIGQWGNQSQRTEHILQLFLINHTTPSLPLFE